MYSYFKHQCGFLQSHNTQHSLFLMVEKLKKSLDNRGVGGMLLTDLSNEFVFLTHSLSVAKLAAYSFGYLSDRTQRTKVNNAYSSYTDIKNGVSQGSILGPLLFAIM